MDFNVVLLGDITKAVQGQILQVYRGGIYLLHELTKAQSLTNYIRIEPNKYSHNFHPGT